MPQLLARRIGVIDRDAMVVVLRTIAEHGRDYAQAYEDVSVAAQHFDRKLQVSDGTVDVFD